MKKEALLRPFRRAQINVTRNGEAVVISTRGRDGHTLTQNFPSVLEAHHGLVNERKAATAEAVVKGSLGSAAVGEGINVFVGQKHNPGNIGEALTFAATGVTLLASATSDLIRRRHLSTRKAKALRKYERNRVQGAAGK